MVYRGKPSAGCENCRKAKKRCGLEKPSCERCVKLNKICSGYRDTTSLQIQDETKAVKQRAERQKAKTQAPKAVIPVGLLTPELTDGSSNESTPSATSLDLDLDSDLMDEDDEPIFIPSDTIFGAVDMSLASLILPPKPKPDDVATNYFIHQFTANNHWQFLRGYNNTVTDPCVELAIKACGMAALDNVEHISRGGEYARSMYAQALGLLNDQLRDPQRSKTDASLIAVSMLGYYENLVCDGRESIQSWKAHIKGATQLLRLRGKEQLKTPVGRILFREIRAQVMIQCLWDDFKPPEFLWDYQSKLEETTGDNPITKPVDELTRLCLDFGTLRANMRTRRIPDVRAAQEASELERKLIQWQIECTATYDNWRYYDVDVKDSEHTWDGKVHAYTGHPVPTAWNTWRSMRIMLSRTQEWLCRRFEFSTSEREEQMQYFRRTRRQLTDDICATIPVQLGHASPAYNSPCVLITAYGTIWPTFFAATCALERVGPRSFELLNGQPKLKENASAPGAQALWLLGRLEYISKHVGLRWADGIAATLRGDFKVYENQLDM